MGDEQLAQGEGINLALSEDGHKLLAIYTPTENRVIFDSEWLKEKIAAEGFEHLYLYEDGPARLVKQ